MKPTLRIDFADFWAGFDKQDNLFVRLLKPAYELVIGVDPEVLFYSVFGADFARYECLRIFYTGERVRPNYNQCDFSLSFEHSDFGGRNIRFPFYAYDYEPSQFVKSFDAQTELSQKSRFCNFVYSNPRCLQRNRFFRKLSQYKQVDSGGKLYNNLDGRVGDKIPFLKKYKFTIAFENGLHNGYTTEKIVEPMVARSLPVYWGNPSVADDFDPVSFVNWHDYGSDEAVIERIVHLDTHNDDYCKMLGQPWLRGNSIPPWLSRARLLQGLMSFIEKRNSVHPVGKRARWYIPTAAASVAWAVRRKLRHVGVLRRVKNVWEYLRDRVYRSL